MSEFPYPYQVRNYREGRLSWASTREEAIEKMRADGRPETYACQSDLSQISFAKEGLVDANWMYLPKRTETREPAKRGRRAARR